MSSPRMERISDLMISEISQVLLRKVKDPRVRHVTISDVDVARDLKTAKVYFSVLPGGMDKDEVLDGLNRAAGYIRSELFHVLRFKSIPRLIFKLDPSIEYGAHIEKLLHTLHNGKDEDEDGES
ncbi:MAG: 30S ribosome-binding factor RbfA [Deltaproteobacteria bacterium]|nr:30S ribosome-binding factor RbfA [Deltaproteobacteria bacterium]